MDAKVLDGCDLATELVREVRADAAEDRFFTNRANMDMADRVISIVVTVLVHKGKPPQRYLSPLWWFLFLREGRDADGRPYGRRYCR